MYKRLSLFKDSRFFFLIFHTERLNYLKINLSWHVLLVT